MNPVVDLNFIENWKGLTQIYEEMEANGFFAHRTYLSHVMSICSDDYWGSNLLFYLDEVAKEGLSSGVLEGFRGKYRSNYGFFKSQFLDKLEVEFGANYESGNPHVGIVRTFVHPAVKAAQELNLKLSHMKRVEEINSIEDQKEAECRIPICDFPYWNEKGATFRKYLNNILNRNSFTSVHAPPGEGAATKKWHYFQNNNNLQACCAFDGGAGNLIFGRIPLIFWLNTGGEFRFL